MISVSLQEEALITHVPVWLARIVYKISHNLQE